MSFAGGFPDNSRFTPVPNLLFGPLLEEIDDLPALKCLLRALWLHSQKKGFPRFLTWDELVADRTIVRVMSTVDAPTDSALRDTLGRITSLGLLIHMRFGEGRGAVDVYIPNTQEGRRAAAHLETNNPDVVSTVQGKPLPAPASRPNIFSMYEENIGIIAPMMAEKLKEAEKIYPEAWIEEAFREAVERNKRSWRYIEAILERWTTEGRDDGEPGRHSKKIDSREWIRRYGLPRLPR